MRGAPPVKLADGQHSDQPGMNVTFGRWSNWQLADLPSYHQPMPAPDLYPKLAAQPLREAGKIKRIGPAKGGYWQVLP